MHEGACRLRQTKWEDNQINDDIVKIMMDYKDQMYQNNEMHDSHNYE